MMQQSRVSWSQVRKSVQQVNPEIADAIDALDPSDEYYFILAHYPFGYQFYHNGHFQEQDQPCEQCGPLALQLTKTSEAFLQSHNHISPIKLYYPGQCLGLEKTLKQLHDIPSDPTTYQVVAGARSVFMLPKITETRGHKRLQRAYKFTTPPPIKAVDHWQVLKHIAHAAYSPWQSQILHFSTQWFQRRHNSPEWQHFYYTLFQQALKQAPNHLSSPYFNHLWQHVSKTIGDSGTKPNSYLIYTLKQLAGIALGDNVGFCFADDQNISVPYPEFQNAYSEHYQLDDIAPHCIAPAQRTPQHAHECLYYSLSQPTLLYSSPDIRKASSTIKELRLLKRLSSLLNLTATQHPEIPWPTKAMQFDFFHSEEDKYEGILNSEKIPTFDPIVFSQLENCFRGQKIASHGHFLRGCVLSKFNTPE